MSLRAVLLIALLVFCVAPQPGAAQKPLSPAPSMKPLHPEWQKIHKAGLIVIGTLVTHAEDPATLSGGDPKAFQKPVLLELRNAQTIKGALPDAPDTSTSVSVRVQYHLSLVTPQRERELNALQALQNRPVLVFAQSANPFAEPSALLEMDAFAVVAARPDDARTIRVELKNQAALKAWFPTSPMAKAAPNDPWEKMVAQGLDRLVRAAQIDKTAEMPTGDAQKRLQARVEEMEKWGPHSHAALIRHLSDPRTLPHLLIGFATPPGFWESRYYAYPETVIFVINSVLEFSTRADLTPISLRPGANEAQSVAVITQAWWVYLVYSRASAPPATRR